MAIPMPQFGFKYYALHYLNLWISQDQAYCKALTGCDDEEKLKTLADAAASYRIARTLRKRYDEGKRLRRYEPVLEIIDAQTHKDFEGDQLLRSIEKVRSEISARYGGRNVLSLATKFLWLKIKSPIVIYDSRASRALQTAPGDIESYYSEWHKAFGNFAGPIDAACTSLQDVFEYTVNPGLATPQYIAEMAMQQWFKERVLDSYLWHLGSKS